jgi:hypothetical protein
MRVPWTSWKISKHVLWTRLEIYCPYACSGNTFKIAQACLDNTSTTFQRVQRTRMSDFQACSVKHLQIMKFFAKWGLKFIYFLYNIKNSQAKDKFKNRRRTCRKYWFNIEDDKKGQNISCQSPFKLGSRPILYSSIAALVRSLLASASSTTSYVVVVAYRTNAQSFICININSNSSVVSGNKGVSLPLKNHRAHLNVVSSKLCFFHLF